MYQNVYRDKQVREHKRVGYSKGVKDVTAEFETVIISHNTGSYRVTNTGWATISSQAECEYIITVAEAKNRERITDVSNTVLMCRVVVGVEHHLHIEPGGDNSLQNAVCASVAQCGHPAGTTACMMHSK